MKLSIELIPGLRVVSPLPLYAIVLETVRFFQVYTILERSGKGVEWRFWCKILLVTLKHCGRVTQICIFNTVKLGTSASSP